jgi:hypothetical protein
MPWPRLPVRIAALVVLVVLASCGKDATSVPATLVFSPSQINLTPGTPSATLTVTSSPPGAPLQWQITDHPDWITASPVSGSTSQGSVAISVEGVGLATLLPGIHRGHFEISHADGLARVPLQALIPESGAVFFTPTSLEFDVGVQSQTVDVINVGNVRITWVVQPPPSAVSVAPSNGTIDPGNGISLAITVDRHGLPPGPTDVSLGISTDVVAGIVLPIRILVAPGPDIAVSPGRVRFPAGSTSGAFVISNPGTADLAWSIESPDAWLSLSSTSGVIEAGGSRTVESTIDRAALPAPDVESSVVVVSNALKGDVTVGVSVSSVASWSEGFVPFAHRVVDAEYSRSTDLLVTVSAGPPRLHIADPGLGTARSVPLVLPPTAVAVSPDGRYAAVGHDGYISHVNLGSGLVERVYPVTTRVFDLVLPGNGWVYAMPTEDGIQSIRCIRLSTGIERPHEGYSIGGETSIRLHPSGYYVYGANRDSSPSDIEKYSVADGTAEYLYDSPYHGDFDFDGNIWISDDGLRLFARSGNVFRSSQVPSQDMLYAGHLEGVSFASWVEHSTAADRVFVFDTPHSGDRPALEMLVYEPAFLGSVGTVELPQFPAPAGGETFDSHGQFIFAHSSGDWVYALVRAAPQSGYALDWAVLVIPRQDLP